MELKLGTNIILESISSENRESFRCKIVEQKNNTIYIDYPVNTKTNKTAFLIEGSQYRASFVDESKVAHAFKTQVLGRVMSNIPMIMLSFPTDDEIIKIQRREFVRVLTPVDVAIEYNHQYFQFITEDISAGGLAIIINQPVPFKENDEVELTIVLPFTNLSDGVQYVHTSAKVVRFIEKDNTVIAPLQFSNTDDIDRQNIIRFCFERQLQIRKKETAF
ncbi:flagellar brake protein [Rummeliibacillus sp. TYF005]|uniref:flagellar brake protein n=2 Tax=unclassified Rummeliibacillus TaxID=2622809 RepID=UPI000E66D82F|nr:flagellar brake domain-containing protein [Rummeliibacillus sp. TYF005]RIJ63173.1 glycosyltransferase [Rummeliibacillus sp. POC4]RPJ93966.1 glycosyltransferase [Rummeliibacillus sp. TYF005]